jgi:Bacterial EndoU nuclease
MNIDRVVQDMRHSAELQDQPREPAAGVQANERMRTQDIRPGRDVYRAYEPMRLVPAILVTPGTRSGGRWGNLIHRLHADATLRHAALLPQNHLRIEPSSRTGWLQAATNLRAQFSADAQTLLAQAQGTSLNVADTRALTTVATAVHQRFAAQAADKTAFDALLHQAFGDKFDVTKAEVIRQQVLAGDFSWAPKIEVVDSKALADLSGTQGPGQAMGAYAAATDTIYLSRELLHSDPAQAQRTLMEETGHGIDARINNTDAAGDEGEIFAKLMHGDTISAQEMTALKTENDHGQIDIHGQRSAVEYRNFVKSIANAVKNVVSAVTTGAVNLTKAAVHTAVNVTTGLVTMDFGRVQRGFSDGIREGAQAISTAAKETHKAIQDAARELEKAARKDFQKLMQSKVFAAVLMVCRFIPIPIVQLVVRIIDVVRAAYMVYQGIKNKSFAMVLGGVASLASGGSQLAGALGATTSTVEAIASIATRASQLSMAYNAVANKDLGAAMGLLAGAVGGPSASPTMAGLASAAGYAQQAINIGQAVRNHDTMGAISSGLSFAGAAAGNSELGQNLAKVQDVLNGGRALDALRKGNLDQAQAFVSSTSWATGAGAKADAASAKQREAEATANRPDYRSLLNQADAELRSAPAEQETVTERTEPNHGATQVAANDPTAANYRNSADIDSDNTATRNGGVGPVSTTTVLNVSKGNTAIDIAKAQYGDQWRAGLAQMVLDNHIKLNEFGSPILREGQALTLNDLSGKSQQELDSLSKLGARVVTNNDRGLRARAELLERQRVAQEQSAQQLSALPAASASSASFASLSADDGSLRFAGYATPSAAAEESLAMRFGHGLVGAAKAVMIEPLLQTRDLVMAGSAVVYNEVLKDKSTPMWLPEMKSGLAEAYANGASQTRLILQSNFVTGAGVLSYDFTTAVKNGQWGDVAELTGGLAGGFALGKVVGRYGDYGIAIEDIGANGFRASQRGAIGIRLVAPEVTAEGKATSFSGWQLKDGLLERERTQTRPDTSADAQYVAKTDRSVVVDNNFDVQHVLAGEVNANNKATGYHAEFAADGSARIRDGSTVTQNPNGTYAAAVDVWDARRNVWVEKFAKSTFFSKEWSEAKIMYEVTEAFKVKQVNPEGGWLGTSPSGVKLQFYWDAKNQRTTFYPLGG